eukprot:1910949-Rhodomonas_salina.2
MSTAARSSRRARGVKSASGPCVASDERRIGILCVSSGKKCSGESSESTTAATGPDPDTAPQAKSHHWPHDHDMMSGRTRTLSVHSNRLREDGRLDGRLQGAGIGSGLGPGGGESRRA